jgi:predicted nucleic acid-binding protein
MRSVRCVGESHPCCAPAPIIVRLVLRRLVQREEITTVRAEQGLEDFSQMLIDRHGHQPLTARIWELRKSLTVYDGAYVALAEALEAPLPTCDAKLARAHGHQAKVELIADE